VIVIDSSTLAKYILKEENWKEVRRYLTRKICTVELIIKEVSNSIWKRQKLQGKINRETAVELFNALKLLINNKVIQIEPQDQYIDKAFEITLSRRITIYDAIYLAQALRYGKILTCDKKQANIGEKLGIETIYIE